MDTVSGKVDKCSGRANTRKHRVYGGMVEFTRRFNAVQKQIQKLVVGQVKQFIQTEDILVIENSFMAVQKTRQKQIVLQKAPPGAPAQPASTGQIGLMPAC